jgi:hypothetical protein
MYNIIKTQFISKFIYKKMYFISKTNQITKRKFEMN